MFVHLKRKTGNLSFEYFPAFGKYLLENRLEEFVKEYLHEMFYLQLPALKYFDIKSSTEEELFEVSRKSSKDYLTYISENKLDDHLKGSIEKWITNQLPVITKDQIIVEDITLTVYIRKRVFLKFVPEYFPDIADAIKLIGEIDEYCHETATASFIAYMSIQQEQMKSTNLILQRHEEQLLEAQEISGLGSFDWDLTGRGNSHYTPQLYKIFEMEKNSNLPDFLNYVHPTDRPKLNAAIEKSLKGEGDYECEYRYIKNGKEKVIWSRGIVIFENRKPVMMKGTVMDVTDRHHMVSKLQRSEELHNQAQALTHIGNWSWLVTEDKISWSDELYRIYGLEPQSEKITFERFLSFIHPDDREERKRQIQHTLLTNKADDYVMRIVTPDGTVKYLQGKGSVLVDLDNKPYKLLGTCQDITQHMLLNEERNRLYASLQEKNIELEKSNKELAAFNYVTSHDLQEPLRKIKIFSSRIADTEFGLLSENGKKYFEKIQSSAYQMQNFIDDLLTFSNTQSSIGVFEPVAINVIVDEIKNFYAEPAGKNSPLIEYNSLPVIQAIPFQVRQLFMNIIGNSIKYSKPDSVPCINIHSETINGNHIKLPDFNKYENYYKIGVRDNGIGFEQHHADKIFEVFQRLHDKKQYPGTGIGLSICKKIMENHKGYITAMGEPDNGATFEVYFPVVK